MAKAILCEALLAFAIGFAIVVPVATRLAIRLAIAIGFAVGFAIGFKLFAIRFKRYCLLRSLAHALASPQANKLGQLCAGRLDSSESLLPKISYPKAIEIGCLWET